jgi:hypothetical protein
VYFWHMRVMLDGCIWVLGLVVLWRFDDECFDLVFCGLDCEMAERLLFLGFASRLVVIC